MTSLSVLLGKSLTRLHGAGFPRLSAALASRLLPDRRFAIDADGDWINRQQDWAFASPDPHMLRMAYVEEQTRDAWLTHYHPQPEDIVFDIGAGIGEEALALSPLVKHVYAVEAHPRTFRCLQKSIALSGRTNITAIQCALADRDGTLAIATGASHLASSVMTQGQDSVEVPARTLASLCRELGITHIDFLKMNIEGAERLAVRGFGDVEIRNLAISCHDFIPGEHYRTRAEVTALLEQQGYTVEGRRDDPRPWTREMLYAR